ncbi:MAG: RNA polymerase sporulation sigma factor SigE [Firmicutes bacterium]|nr:RNA polymerase sporulation sigma factor SigE [Bacillota bacterium]
MKLFAKIADFFKNVFKRIAGAFRRLFGREKGVLHYITGGEALPLPLSAEDEAETILRYAGGDQTAKSRLIEHNLRLVVYIARKFDNTGVDPEDLISIGTIGLIKAVSSFDCGKNIKLATYASRCIENEILMHLRRMVKIRMEVSLDEPLNVDFEGNELLMSDILGTDPDLVSRNIESKVEKGLLWTAIEKLNKRERTIMQMRFGLMGKSEKTQKEVADLLGISQSYISRLEKKIIFRLKKEIAKAL